MVFLSSGNLDANTWVSCSDHGRNTARQCDCKEVLRVVGGAVAVDFDRYGAQRVLGVLFPWVPLPKQTQNKDQTNT